LTDNFYFPFSFSFSKILSPVHCYSPVLCFWSSQVSELQGKQKLAVNVTSGLKDLLGTSGSLYIFCVQRPFRNRELYLHSLPCERAQNSADVLFPRPIHNHIQSLRAPAPHLKASSGMNTQP
jgi:hypothetical protein